MKKRTITLVIQPSGNIRSIRNNDPKKGSAGEIRFTFTGGRWTPSTLRTFRKL